MRVCMRYDTECITVGLEVLFLLICGLQMLIRKIKSWLSDSSNDIIACSCARHGPGHFLPCVAPDHIRVTVYLNHVNF